MNNKPKYNEKNYIEQKIKENNAQITRLLAENEELLRGAGFDPPAKNRNQLMKAVTLAEELGLKENKDFFLIKDNCLTELEPEEVDGNGVGRTLICIGFRPLPDDVAHTVSKKYQLFK